MKNINCVRISNTKLTLFFVLVSMLVFSQNDSIRVMSYNLMMYPSGTTYSRNTYLHDILNEYKPDILTVCEMETSQAATDLLTDVLQPINPAYRAARFESNHSNPNVNLQQLLYYNSEKLELHSQTYLTTDIRDINKYTLYLKTTSLASGDTLFIDVYAMHLKASAGTTNETKRLDMVRVLTEDLTHTPHDRYVLVTGDFNIYYASEPAYTELTDSTNAVILKDPIDSPGYWHNNSSYASLHTQSPNRNKGGNFVGGGLDDRFDFIMVSENLMNSQNDLYYKTDTYSAYGNNGNCFNNDINNTTCSGNYSQTLRDNLYEMSDHIPVVMTLETTQNFIGIEEFVRRKVSIFPNPVQDFLYILPAEHAFYLITDSAGKIVKSHLDGNDEKWYIGDLKPGVYYVYNENKTGLPAKFIKI